MTLSQAVETMLGPAGSEIKLTILRPGQTNPIEMSITREVIQLCSVRWRLEGADIGYFRVIQFDEQTTKALGKGLGEINDKVPADKLKGYILDLRNNPGGLLDQAISVADVFLGEGEIVSTRGRNPQATARYMARPGDLADGKPIIVLINGGSASAAEMLLVRCRIISVQRS